MESVSPIATLKDDPEGRSEGKVSTGQVNERHVATFLNNKQFEIWALHGGVKCNIH